MKCYQKGKSKLDFTEASFSKIQFAFAFLVPAHPGSPAKRAVKRVCVSAVTVLVLDVWISLSSGIIRWRLEAARVVRY